MNKYTPKRTYKLILQRFTDKVFTIQELCAATGLKETRAGEIVRSLVSERLLYRESVVSERGRIYLYATNLEVLRDEVELCEEKREKARLENITRKKEMARNRKDRPTNADELLSLLRKVFGSKAFSCDAAYKKAVLGISKESLQVRLWKLAKEGRLACWHEIPLRWKKQTVKYFCFPEYEEQNRKREVRPPDLADDDYDPIPENHRETFEIQLMGDALQRYLAFRETYVRYGDTHEQVEARNQIIERNNNANN